jgi:hypothetical protein
MTSPTLLSFDHAAFDAQAIEAVLGIGNELARTLSIARLLIERGRAVDLTGLDRGMGLLCAKALDLPYESGRSLRPFLCELLAQVEQFTIFLESASGSRRPSRPAA